MKHKPLSTFILGILGLFAAYLAYELFYLEDPSGSVYLIPLGISIAIVLVFKPQIDFWWYKKYPPRLDEPVIQWLVQHFPYFPPLSREDKSLFIDRLALYLEAREFKFMRKEAEDMPHDFQAMIAAHAVLMSMSNKDYLIGDFDRIICYPHAFPTPKFKFLHTVETHTEDGLILLSSEHLLLGVLKPQSFLNIIFYAFAEAIYFLNDYEGLPELPGDIWERIEEISGFSKPAISKLLGFDEPDPVYVLMSLFFSHKDRIKAALPDIYTSIEKLLGNER